MGELPVIIEKLEGGVGLLTLNKPSRLNSWDEALAQCLWDGLDQFALDPDIRVIVITGAGRAFCAGADMKGLAAQAGGDEGLFHSRPSGFAVAQGTSVYRQSRDPRGKPRSILHATTVPKPVIAAINGAAAGLGLALACSCDFRFAARDAKLTSAFSKLGLIAEHGLSWTLPHQIGIGNAMRLLMSSDVVTGQEAMGMGLVQKCFSKEDLLKETVAYARNLAVTVPANNLAVIKQQVWRHPNMSNEDALKSSNRLMDASTKDNPDYKEGVKAFTTKKPAKWAPFDLNSKILRAAEDEFGRWSKL